MARIKTPPFFLPVLFALALVSKAEAASLTLAWDPPTDGVTAGYIVVYGTSPGNFTTRMDLGFVTQRQIDGLADGTTYYFGVQAYSSTGELSFLASVEGTTPTGAVTGETPTKTRPGKGKGRVKPTATVTDDQYISLAWEAESADLAPGAALSAPVGYRVEVGTAFGDTSYSALTKANALSFDMTDLPADKYFVRVRPVMVAAGGLAFGHVTEEAVVVPGRPIRLDARGNPQDAASSCVAAPGAPRQLTPSAQGNAVGLNWQRGSWDAPASYFLQVGTSPGQQDVLTAEFPANVTGVTAMAGNAAYALRMSAVNQCGSSLWAPEAMLYVGVAPLPGMVLELTQQVSGGLVTLTWEPPATGGPVTRYLIEAATPFGPFAYDTGTTATGFSNANTPPGQYLVTVRAGNATGFGVATSPIVVTIP